MARFRPVFWLVVWMGALPSLLSGLRLLGQFRISSLCGERPAGGAQVNPLWLRLHEWGWLSAVLAASLVVGYGLARRRSWRVLALGGLLAAALGAAGWSGRVTPFGTLTAPYLDADEAQGSADYCLTHIDEVRRVRLIYWLHAGSGGVALLLTLALVDFGARWKPTSER